MSNTLLTLHLRPVTARTSDLRYPKSALNLSGDRSFPVRTVVALSTMATPSVSQQTDILNSIFIGLRSKSPETRLQSALDLRRYVCLAQVLGAYAQ